MDASKAFKKSRTTIYEAIKNGELSRDHYTQINDTQAFYFIT